MSSRILSIASLSVRTCRLVAFLPTLCAPFSSTQHQLLQNCFGERFIYEASEEFQPTDIEIVQPSVTPRPDFPPLRAIVGARTGAVGVEERWKELATVNKRRESFEICCHS